MLRRLPLTALALSVAAVGVARNSAACSPPPVGWYAYGGLTKVPENGVVPLHYGCVVACDAPPDPESVKLVGADGSEVQGSVVFSGARDEHERFLVFKPEPGALVAGETYTPVLAGIDFEEPLEVAPAVTWSETFTPTEQIFAVDHVAGEEVCCAGPLDSCGSTPCFYTQFTRQAAMVIDWSVAESLENYQYAFRILRPEFDLVQPWMGGADSRFTLLDDETTVCYTLELKRLVDDTILTLEERCVDRPSDIVPGAYPTSEDDIHSFLARCIDPPAGYEEPWCDAYASYCASPDPNSIACETYAEQCETTGAAGAAAIGGSAGAGGTGAASGATAAGGSGASGGAAPGGTSGGGTSNGGGPAGSAGRADPEAGATGDDSGEGDRIYTKGCGCAVPSARAPAGTSLLWLLALGWAARRRSRVSR